MGCEIATYYRGKQMIKSWDVHEIKRDIDRIYLAESDPKMDGYVTFGCKKDLYHIKWYVDEALAKCSNYEGETEFVKKYERINMIKALSER